MGPVFKMCTYGIGLPFDHPIWRNLPPCTCGQKAPRVEDWRWWRYPIVVDGRHITWTDTTTSTITIESEGTSR